MKKRLFNNRSFRNINHSQTINVLLIVLNVLMFSYFMLLAYYNHFSQDDYGFYMSIRDGGFFDIVKSAYFNFSGRYADYFYISVVYQMISWGMPIWVVQLVILILSAIIIYLFLRLYYNKSSLLTNLSFLIVNTFVFINFEFTAFYWTCATIYYWMAVLPILLFVVIVSKRGNNVVYPVLILLSLFIGGLSEVLVPICIIMLIAYVIYVEYHNKLSIKALVKDKTIMRIIISVVFLIIGFSIIFFSPGSNQRKELYQQTISLFPLIKISFHSLMVYFYLFVFKMPYLIPLLLVFMWYGFVNRPAIRKKTIINQKSLIISFVLFLVFIWINVLPASYVISGFGFQRIYTHTVLYSIFYFSILAYHTGKIIKEKYAVLLKLITCVFLIGFCVAVYFHIQHDVSQAKAYLDSDLKRAELLSDIQQSGFRGVIELDSLKIPKTYSFKYLITNKKQPMLYYLNEIDTVADAFPNTMIKKYYNLDYDIILKK